MLAGANDWSCVVQRPKQRVGLLKLVEAIDWNCMAGALLLGLAGWELLAGAKWSKLDGLLKLVEAID